MSAVLSTSRSSNSECVVEEERLIHQYTYSMLVLMAVLREGAATFTEGSYILVSTLFLAAALALSALALALSLCPDNLEQHYSILLR